jgi:hypothetical protein
MDSHNFFIHTPENALRHVDMLANGLAKVAILGWCGAAACSALAIFFHRLLAPSSLQTNAAPGWQQTSDVSLNAWFLAIGLFLFSSLYFVTARGLRQKKPWARYMGAAAFLLKILLCLWLGRSSVVAIVFFLSVASWDFYGLWVLLAKETGQLFTPPNSAPMQPTQSQTC